MWLIHDMKNILVSFQTGFPDMEACREKITLLFVKIVREILLKTIATQESYAAQLEYSKGSLGIMARSTVSDCRYVFLLKMDKEHKEFDQISGRGLTMQDNLLRLSWVGLRQEVGAAWGLVEKRAQRCLSKVWPRNSNNTL
jgi:hypothetical protein